MSSKIFSILLCALALASAAIQAADEGGVVTGIVASKGDTWLGVRAEGQDEPSLFMPYWKGAGFDGEMLGTIKNIALGSKVKLTWKQDEHPRIVSVETLAVPEKPPVAEKRPEKMVDKERMGERERIGDKERMTEKERMMAEREKERMAEREKARHGGEKGSLTGVVISKGESFIEVKQDKDTPAEKYFPRYIGGEDGGPDKEMLRTFSRLKVGEWIKLDWTMDERRRAVKVERAPQQ